MENFAIKIFENNKIDYLSLKNKSILNINNKDEIFDINFIVPVKGDVSLFSFFYNCFNNAIQKTNLNINLTVVERSIKPEHLLFCKSNSIDYIHIYSNGEAFNKCLSYNCGFLFGNKSKYYIFHDINQIIQQDFFYKIEQVLKDSNLKAIKCFSENKILKCNKEITEKILNKKIKSDFLIRFINDKDIVLDENNTNEGSVLLERGLFLEVGGYDAEIFESNSPETQFFCYKIELLEKISYIKNVDFFKIYNAEYNIDKNLKIDAMIDFIEFFKNINLHEQKKYMNVLCENLDINNENMSSDIVANNELEKIIISNRIDYDRIKEKSIISLLNDEDDYDVNIIIGCRGRKEFILPNIESFESAIKNYPQKKITYTIVEHSYNPEHENICKDRVNYMWTPGNVLEQYSRSFAYNFGVKYGNKAKYYLLHDLDILVKRNFFDELFRNLHEYRFLKPYGNERYLDLDQNLTYSLLSGRVDYNNFNLKTQGVFLPQSFTNSNSINKGGTIFVERELFFEVGGFDPEIMWGYAPEDALFYDKAELLTSVGKSNSPSIDIFHMYHPPSYFSNPLLNKMENNYRFFKGLNNKEKESFIRLKKNLYI